MFTHALKSFGVTLAAHAMLLASAAVAADTISIDTMVFPKAGDCSFRRHDGTQCTATASMLPMNVRKVEGDRLVVMGGTVAQDDVVSQSAAKAHYESLLKQDPKNVWARFMLAEYWLCVDDLDKASANARAVLELDAKHVDAHVLLATVQWYQNEYNAALQTVETALRLDAKHSLAYCTRGLIKESQGDLNAAAKDFAEAARLDARWPAIHFFISRVAEGLNDPDQYVKSLAEAVAQDPDNPAFIASLGMAFLDLGQPDKAIVAFDEWLRIEPQSPEGFAMRGRARFEKGGENELALDDFNQAIKLQPDLWIPYFYRAQIYWAADKTPAALADFNRAAELNPEESQIFGNRASLYVALDQTEEALADFTKALDLNPKAGDYFFLRGQLLMGGGELDQAISDYNQALENELSGNFRYLALLMRARTYDYQGKYKEALAEYAQAEPLAPEDPLSYTARAFLLAACPDAALRNGKEALRLATKACELTKYSDFGALDALAAAQAELGDFEDAVRWQTKSLTMPGHTEVNLAEGRARLELYQAKKPYRDER